MTRYYRTPITDINGIDIMSGHKVEIELSDDTLAHFEQSKREYKEKINTYGEQYVPECLRS